MAHKEAGYSSLFSKEVLVWALTALASKAPVAMAPLALVFLVREQPGGYTLGPTLASAYVLGEVVGAPVLGTRLARYRMRPQLVVGLLAGAVVFAALPLARSSPAAILACLAFLAGAAPAACPGGIRSILTQLVVEENVPRALSAEAMLTQITWAVSPGVVVFLALSVHPGAPLVLCAALAFGGSALLFVLPESSGGSQETGQTTGRLTRTLLSGWPVYLTSAAALSMLATAELVLPALLEGRELAVGWSGPLLAAFAAMSAVGAFCYGLRTWPGSISAQSLLCLSITAVCVSFVALLPALPGIALALMAAGFFQAGVMVTRNLMLRQLLPTHAQAAGYSIMYAVQGVGYSLTASVSAIVLHVASPSVAILGGVFITIVLAVISALSERRSPQFNNSKITPTRSVESSP